MLDAKTIIEKTLVISSERPETTVYFVVNVDGQTIVNDYRNPGHTILTEYLTDDEYNDMVSAIKESRFNLQVFCNEDDFIRFALQNKDEIKKLNPVVFNLARNGKGLNKKALIPAFCNLHDIPITGSGAYHVCLGRHKFHVNSILSSNNIAVAKSWMYTSSGWLLAQKPPLGMRLILKPVFESASRGITHDSIALMDNCIEAKLLDLRLRFNQDVIVQEFISGYEVGVPIIISDKAVPLLSVGVSMGSETYLGDRIITFEDAFNETYAFYNFDKTSRDLSNAIKKAAIEAAECLGLEQYCRIDFRVTSSGMFYITDTSTHPFLIRHSAFAFAFSQLGFAFTDIFAFLINQRQLEFNDVRDS